MKKSIFTFSFLIAVFLFNTSAFSQVLKWYNFNEGYKIATKEKKVILIDVYTEWCGWCKKMDKDTYAQKIVIEALNKNFVAIKLNPEIEGSYTYDGKTYNGKQLVDVLSNNKLSGYPTTIFQIIRTKKTYLEVGYKGKDDMGILLAKYAKMK